MSIRELYDFYTTDWISVEKKTTKAIRENSAPTPPDYMQLHADRYEIDEGT